MKFVNFKSSIKEVVKDIDLETRARVRRGAAVGARAMRKNANKKGKSTPRGFPAKITGAFKKSIGYSVLKGAYLAFVGSRSGLVHLFEFGWGDGKENNKRPIVGPSLIASEDAMVKEMSKPFW